MLIHLANRGVRRPNVAADDAPGSPLFFDDFNYSMARGASDAAKIAAVQAAGWAYIKDEARNDGAAGYLYTATAVPGDSQPIPGLSGTGSLLLAKGSERPWMKCTPWACTK